MFKEQPELLATRSAPSSHGEAPAFQVKCFTSCCEQAQRDVQGAAGDAGHALCAQQPPQLPIQLPATQCRCSRSASGACQQPRWHHRRRQVSVPAQ